MTPQAAEKINERVREIDLRVKKLERVFSVISEEDFEDLIDSSILKQRIAERNNIFIPYEKAKRG